MFSKPQATHSSHMGYNLERLESYHKLPGATHELRDPDCAMLHLLLLVAIAAGYPCEAFVKRATETARWHPRAQHSVHIVTAVHCDSILRNSKIIEFF